MRGALRQWHGRSDERAAISKVSQWSLRPEVLLLLSSLLYFMPLAVGWWVYVDPRGIPVVSNYHLATVPVVVLALVSILGTIVFLPAMAVDPGAEGAGAATQLEGPILIVLIVLSGLYVVLTPGLFAADKAEVLRATGRGHYLFYNLCVVGFVYCAIAGWGRNRWLLLATVLGIMLALFIGHRWVPALAIAGTLYVAFRDRPVSTIGILTGHHPVESKLFGDVLSRFVRPADIQNRRIDA